MFTAKSIAVRIIERRAVCLEANPIADLANIHVNNRIGLTYYPNRSDVLCEEAKEKVQRGTGIEIREISLRIQNKRSRVSEEDIDRETDVRYVI